MNLSDHGYSRTYANECAAWTISPYTGTARKRCALSANQNVGGWIYLCNRHFQLIEREFEDSIDSLNSRRVANLQQRIEWAEEELKVAKEGVLMDQVRFEMDETERKRRAQTVYFIRCQQYVKIGISMNPATRLQQIRRGGGSHFPRLLDVETAELVTTEPGGFEREKELHAKFAHLRHTGEWFTEAPELTEYIASLDVAA